jgi:hypothetical protein
MDGVANRREEDSKDGYGYVSASSTPAEDMIRSSVPESTTTGIPDMGDLEVQVRMVLHSYR